MVFDTYHHPKLIVMIEKTRTMPLSSLSSSSSSSSTKTEKQQHHNHHDE